jgi:DNA-binding SARP family transcriptional activator
MLQLSLTLFGSFAAAVHNATLHLPTDKARALLVYLALTPDTPLRREMLAGLLWPEQSEAMARQNLRQTAGRLKRAIHEKDPDLAGRLLTLTKQTIELHAAYCQADVVSFRRHLDHGPPPPARLLGPLSRLSGRRRDRCHPLPARRPALWLLTA